MSGHIEAGSFCPVLVSCDAKVTDGTNGGFSVTKTGQGPLSSGVSLLAEVERGWWKGCADDFLPGCGGAKLNLGVGSEH